MDTTPEGAVAEAVVAAAKQYMEKVPGRKEVAETNMAAEVASMARRTFASALLPLLDRAKTRAPSVAAEARPRHPLRPKKTASFGFPRTPMPAADSGLATR